MEPDANTDWCKRKEKKSLSNTTATQLYQQKKTHVMFVHSDGSPHWRFTGSMSLHVDFHAALTWTWLPGRAIKHNQCAFEKCSVVTFTSFASRQPEGVFGLNTKGGLKGKQDYIKSTESHVWALTDMDLSPHVPSLSHRQFSNEMLETTDVYLLKDVVI